MGCKLLELDPKVKGPRKQVVGMAGELETNKLLESIFHPYALKQMEEFVKKQRDQSQASFVHYTSAEAALRILENKRIWMRNVTCMADYSEVQLGFNLLNEILFEGKQAGLNALRPLLVAPRVRQERPSNPSTSGGLTFGSAPILLRFRNTMRVRTNTAAWSMWRAFGGNDVRVALVFKFPFSLLNGKVFNLVVSTALF
jgi:hypothetical protein